MLALQHKKLNVWKAGIELSTLSYKITQNLPWEELYGLISQIRRVAVSVPSNIAEGVARSSGTERKRYYETSRSSLVELDTQIEIAKNLNYFNRINMKKLDEMLNHLFTMLSNLIKNTE